MNPSFMFKALQHSPYLHINVPQQVERLKAFVNTVPLEAESVSHPHLEFNREGALQQIAPHAPYPGAWAGLNAKNANLAGADLNHVDLSGVILRNADLTSANLEGAKLQDSRLADASLSHANLSEANLNGASLPRTNLAHANLSKADLTNASLAESNLTDANLSAANLTDAQLLNATLMRSDLSKTNLTHAHLGGANLQDINAQEANMSSADFFKTNLQGANLGRVNLTNAKIMESDLKDSNLFRANLSGATISSTTNLSGADLRKTNFQKAYLRAVNLGENHTLLEGSKRVPPNMQGANLEGADLTAANLEGANLRGGNLIGANLHNASVDSNTRLDGANLLRVKATYDPSNHTTGVWSAQSPKARLTKADLSGRNIEVPQGGLKGTQLEGVILQPSKEKPILVKDSDKLITVRGGKIIINNTHFSDGLGSPIISDATLMGNTFSSKTKPRMTDSLILHNNMFIEKNGNLRPLEKMDLRPRSTGNKFVN